jgi:histidinol-phosphate aminotransferase
MVDPLTLVRENILHLRPYSSARSEYSGNAAVWLDANENPLGKNGLNRYPDPTQNELRNRISQLKNIGIGHIFLGNGSDEPIDLLIRAFCEPHRDKILIFTPTYGMYRVCAAINAVEVLALPLNESFQPDVEDILHLTENDKSIKIIFICSPNNPTGNVINHESIDQILQHFKGIVVIDEAYIDFSGRESYIDIIQEYPCLLVLQTLSKAWAMAGIRLGIAYGSEPVIRILNSIKPPYNINTLTQREALSCIDNQQKMESEVRLLISERARLHHALGQMPLFSKVYPSDANFILATCPVADRLYNYLSANGIIIRNRSSELPGALRITVGTPEENNLLISALKKFTP